MHTVLTEPIKNKGTVDSRKQRSVVIVHLNRHANLVTLFASFLTFAIFNLQTMHNFLSVVDINMNSCSWVFADVKLILYFYEDIFSLYLSLILTAHHV